MRGGERGGCKEKGGGHVGKNLGGGKVRGGERGGREER